MKLSLYSIYDLVAEVFNKPYTGLNDADAIRSFKSSLVENPNKNDYAVYKVGEYNDSNGQIKSQNPEKIFTGFDIKLTEE